MRLRDAEVGDVLERTNRHGDTETVRVTAHSATRGETWFLPVGVRLAGGESGYLDVERFADWARREAVE